MVTFHAVKTIHVSILVAFAASAWAAPVTVYRHIGADGVVSFGDQPRDGADVLTVDVREPRADEVARSVERFDTQLLLIELLQADRRAREAADLDRRLSQLELEFERARARPAKTELGETGYRYAPWFARDPNWHHLHRRPGADVRPPRPPAQAERVSAPLGKFR